MKRLLFLALAFSACSSEEQKQIPFSTANLPEEEWAVYEGKIITDKGLIVDVEVSLEQAAVGVDARFKMLKSAISGNQSFMAQAQGKYAVSYGLPQNEQGLTFIDQSKGIQGMASPANRNQIVQTASNVVLDGMKTPELNFKTVGNEKLVQTDRNFNPKDPKYALVRRSDFFTVEGYITCQDSLVEFYERNTMRTWNVASYGAIDSVKIKYLSLATESFEGVYLKAVGFSIADTTQKEKKSLVIKRLIRMAKSDPRKPNQ